MKVQNGKDRQVWERTGIDEVKRYANVNVILTPESNSAQTGHQKRHSVQFDKAMHRQCTSIILAMWKQRSSKEGESEKGGKGSRGGCECRAHG